MLQRKSTTDGTMLSPGHFAAYKGNAASTNRSQIQHESEIRRECSVRMIARRDRVAARDGFASIGK
jgi:hypothetical protein